MGKQNSYQKNKASTLLELMIVMALFTIVLSTAYSLFIPGIHMFRNSQANVTSQQNAYKTLDAIGRDLRHTNFNSLSFIAKTITLHGVQYTEHPVTPFDFPLLAQVETRAIAFLSPFDGNFDGNNEYVIDASSNRISWQRFVVYYLVDTNENINGVPQYDLYQKILTKSEITSSSPVETLPTDIPFRLAPVDLKSAIQDTENAKKIASNIAHLYFSHPTLTSIEMTVFASVNYTRNAGHATNEIHSIINLHQ